ncbi:MAG: sirohydrochlorin chelatase [Rhodocyclaceae bacterium]|nr:sirohydrochlorin chelatase [Rhodocyclaceae bacterium]
MNDTILLVGHGSREVAGNHDILVFADKWRTRHFDWRIEVCFIEHADVLLEAGLDAAALNSARVLVVPLILNAAGHVQEDIPNAIEAARQRHPQVLFHATKHLGMNLTILEVLQKRVRTALRELDMPDPQTTGIILLGRGSSEANANAEVAKMARWLFEKNEFDLVDVAFTGITWPRIETVVQRHAREGMTQIIVLPLYLFTGVLTERIQQQMVRIKKSWPLIAFALGSPIGSDEGILDLLDQRVSENEVSEKRSFSGD